MIDPILTRPGEFVKKYSDEQIEKCKQKIEFIETRLVDVNTMDVEYRVMIADILQDYKSKLWQMEHDVEYKPYSEVIY